ncbi:MAG: hypothetical protein COU46_02360 [Candidatus Niyogibacteria bacterium CG10_big_fil_rev_8_21_14_0_10_42_19]|uniref:Cell division protein FtsL n=1 Tax=Candidatus Niyogibacteria bacterium CG10_big_fil_rev_8_21_14_0_10_42_19 TaxID=1974725 RepID=A0A2H0TFE9_9BACT|nr:MAG: hypothetical protein COU46_02360 [Candidatus Niyogibacteria bacterium CG10_big_fil_rev_8_21_14_0_10_42_19]
MREFQPQKKSGILKKIVYSRVVVILLMIILGASVIKTSRTYIGYRNLALEHEAIKKQIEETKNGSQELKEALELFDGEFGKERVLKERFNVKKDGEEVIVLIDGPRAENNEKTENNIAGKIKKAGEWIKKIFSDIIKQ